MRRKMMLIGATISTAALPVSVFAESTGTANTEVVSAMTGVAADMTATANAVIPVALSVVGIALVVVFGIRIFKKIISK